ncbi:MAG: DUF1015 domain-containing protein [Tannerellaceae bacterium]
MVKVKPFKGYRPPKQYVKQIASRPYDVLSSTEALIETGDNEMSLFHIIKPEIDFNNEVDEHDEQVYARASKNLSKFIRNGWLRQDEKDCYYLYAQKMGEHIQYGIVVCASVEDYVNGVIKKHELTRKDKEEDRMKHVRVTNANMEPVFFAYEDHPVLSQIVERVKALTPEYQFKAEDGIEHIFWIIDDDEKMQSITKSFSGIKNFYIADGHHRSAAAALVGAEKMHGDLLDAHEVESDYFMAVCFPKSELKILDYNRLVRDLNGLSDDEFFILLSRDFHIKESDIVRAHPSQSDEFGIYLSGKWFRIKAKDGTYDAQHPIESLGAEICSRLILEKILGVKDLRTDNRIDFVGGIRGYETLQSRVDSGEMQMAIGVCPVSMDQLIKVADTGNIMPPKSTWFEPKLRSGLVVHLLD